MKKRILILIDSLKIGGGAEKFISILSTKLSKTYDIFILTFHDFKNIYPFKGKYYSIGKKSIFNSKFLNFLKINNFLISIRIYRVITSISPDVLISAMDYTNIFTILTKIFFFLKNPLIISVFCNPKIQYLNDRKYLNLLIKLFYPLNQVNKIITISEGVKQILKSDYQINEKKLISINNGVDFKEIQSLAKSKIREYKDIFENRDLIKFITIGRLAELKGHKYLVEAYKKVKKEIPNSKLIIRGDGPLKKELEILINKYNLDNDIIFLGIKQNIYKYLARSDIFILSSKSEGLPTVLLEALACRLPIISTNCETGPSEILNNGQFGLLVKVMDSNDLAEKMIQLGNDKELMNRFSLKANDRIKSYTIEKTINDWIEIIEQVINNTK